MRESLPRGRFAGAQRAVKMAYPLLSAAESCPIGLLAELADAMDSKSIARKGISVRLR